MVLELRLNLAPSLNRFDGSYVEAQSCSKLGQVIVPKLNYVKAFEI